MKPLTKNAMLRDSCAKPGLPVWIEILIFIAVFYVSQVLISIPLSVAELFWLFPWMKNNDIVSLVQHGSLWDAIMQITASMPSWLWLVNLFCTALMTATVILFCRLFQKRSLPSLGFRRRHAAQEYLIGALVGAALFSLAVLLCWLTGSLTLEKSSFSVGMWILFLLGFIIQGMSEEVLCRGYFMPSLARKSSLLWAILINSLLFSALHLFNPGISIIALLNIALFGILASLYVLRRGDIWGACAMHSLWNFVQGNVFGIHVSGNPIGTSPFSASLPASHKLWNGGDFGLEGGLAVTLVLSIGIFLFLFVIPSKKEE